MRRPIFTALVFPLSVIFAMSGQASGQSDLPPGPDHLLRAPGTGSVEDKIKDCRLIEAEIKASKVEISALEAKIAERTKLSGETKKKLDADQAKTNLTKLEIIALNKTVADFNAEVEARNVLIKQMNKMIYEATPRLNSYNTYCTGTYLQTRPK